MISLSVIWLVLGLYLIWNATKQETTLGLNFGMTFGLLFLINAFALALGTTVVMTVLLAGFALLYLVTAVIEYKYGTVKRSAYYLLTSVISGTVFVLVLNS